MLCVWIHQRASFPPTCSLCGFLPVVGSAELKLTFDFETRTASPLKTQVSLSLQDKGIDQKTELNSALNKK